MKSLPDQVFFVVRDGEPISFVADYDTEVFFSRDDAEACAEEGDELVEFVRDAELATLRQRIAELEAEVATAQRERDATRTDTERMNTIEGDIPTTIIRFRESECVGNVVQFGESQFTGKTLRDAVDAKRAAIRAADDKRTGGGK